MTLSLPQAIKDAIEAKLYEVNTSMPAIVIGVDKATDLIAVQPVIKRKYADGTVASLPVIQNVPLATYRTKAAYISMPVKIGDYVMLVMSQRSIDRWLDLGGEVDPKDPRRHHLSDAMAYPGVYPKTDPVIAPFSASLSDDLVMKNGESEIVMKDDGKFRVYSGDFELLEQISELIQTIIDARTNTIFGPQPLIPLIPAAFLLIKNRIDSMRA